MRITIATTAHTPNDGRMGYKTALSLLDRGIEVTWLGPDADLPEELAQIDYRPAGAGGRLRRFLVASRIAATLPKTSQWVITPDPDMLAALVARRIMRRGIRIAFDVHEDFTGYALHRNLGSVPGGRFLIPVAARVLRWLASRADYAYGVNEDVLAALDCSTRHVVVNTPRENFASPSAARRDDGIFRVYHGKATEHHGTASVLAAARSLDRKDVRVVLVESSERDPFGGGRSLSSTLRAHGLDGLGEIRAKVPYREMPGEYGRCDVGVIAYSGRSAEMSLPNRLFEYAASGLPVVVPAHSPLMAIFVEEHGIGTVVDTNDPDAIAQALAHWLDHPDERRAIGSRAAELFRSCYTWESQFDVVVRELTSRV